MITFHIQPLARAEFEAARERLFTQGITITGDEGKIESRKVGIDFAYNGTDTLTITMEHKPWIVPASEVEGKIREWFAGNDTDGPA